MPAYLKPSVPSVLFDGTKPSRAAWFLKDTVLPSISLMAKPKGKEWMAMPERLKEAAR